MKKHIVAFICALLLLFTAFSSLGTFASGSEVEEEPTLKELANLTKKSIHILRFNGGIVYIVA